MMRHCGSRPAATFASQRRRLWIRRLARVASAMGGATDHAAVKGASRCTAAQVGQHPCLGDVEQPGCDGDEHARRDQSAVIGLGGRPLDLQLEEPNQKSGKGIGNGGG